MQSRALQDVSDAESKAMKARIDAQIAQKKEERGDTIRDHVVSLMTDGLTNLQNKLQENYEKWEHEFEASSMSQLTVMRDTNMTTAQMASTMNNLLNTFGTSMKNMNLQVNTVNAATKDAVYAVDGKIRAFTGNDTAYGIVLKSNTDMQNRLVASLSGPISDTMANKLANIWRTVTSAGDVTTKATLDTTATMIDTHLKRLEEIESTLPAELTDPLDNIDDTLKDSVYNQNWGQQQIYNAINKVATVVNATGGSIMGEIGMVGSQIVTAIQTTYNNDKQPAEQNNTSTSTPSSSGGDSNALSNARNEASSLSSSRTNIIDQLIKNDNNLRNNENQRQEIVNSKKSKAKKDELLAPLEAQADTYIARYSELAIEYNTIMSQIADIFKKYDVPFDYATLNAGSYTSLYPVRDLGFASGTRRIGKNMSAWTQEDGTELIVRPSDGAILTPLKAGDGVIPADLTKNLFEMARNYPNLPGTEMVQIPNLPNSGMKQNVTISYGSLLNVQGNITKDALPELKQILKESYEYTVSRISTDLRLGGMRKSYR